MALPNVAAMARKKTKSKRVTLKQKYKIKKKVKEHRKKVRKEARKSGPKKKIKKDPGIPNLLPFKEELMEQIKARQDNEKREKELARERRRAEERKKRELAAKATAGGTLGVLQNEAAQRQDIFAQKENLKQKEQQQRGSEGVSARDGSKKAYYREFKKLVEAADVILEVLDARDPLGCRAPEVESAILAADARKRIVIVLNKIDLVPKEIVQQWLVYLRTIFPTVAFKASTQEQKSHIGQSHAPITSATKHTAECLGASSLMHLLKNYARSQGMKKSITVGVIGYPNVGKSSLINSLKRQRVVGVGSTPGFTKKTQEIQLDKSVKLIDSPGIVFASNESETQLVLRNCIKVEHINDPIAPIEAILTRCSKEHILKFYRIANYNNPTEFLTLLAQRRGKLRQGGVADFDATAKIVLNDWTSGKIGGYATPPPPSASKTSKAVAQISLVDQWSKEFNIDDLMTFNAEVIDQLNPSKLNFAQGASCGPMQCDTNLLNSDEESNEEPEVNVLDTSISVAAARSILVDNNVSVPDTNDKRKRDVEDSVEEVVAYDELNFQTNKQRRKQKKKQAKLEKRTKRARLATAQPTDFDAPFDFATDFVADNDDVDGHDDSDEEEIDILG